ncbi:MAG: 50S ribosomal protein L18 [Bdellovibrionales bacterium]|nr:50S ribosomal protein L18 [Bdellovibrionales bacterium]
MRLNFHKKSSQKVISRIKNKVRIRRKITGTGERPRLCVFRSAKHMYAQIVDDSTGKTLATASTKKLGLGSNKDGSKAVGQSIAKQALEKSIQSVVFDRSGYVFHGRVKAVADGAREAGLNF